MIIQRIGYRFAATLLLVVFVGCQPSQVTVSQYGQSTGAAGKNIHGTSLLSVKFREAGHRVTTARTLGRTINRSNVVVWFPDRFDLPSQDTCDFFETWLSAAPGRTLIYVGRDYDPEVAYWRRMDDENSASRTIPAKEKYDVRRWRARSKADYQSYASFRKKSDTCKWLRVDRVADGLDAESLTGPWSSMVAQAKYPPVKTVAVTPVGFGKKRAVDLLSSGDDRLVVKLTRPHWRKNQLIFVANGSMFLNLAMTDPAYQKLADTVVEDCGLPSRVVFLNSDFRDPPIAGAPESHHLLRVFTTSPLRCILMHLSALGMIYCFAVFPIFGKPRKFDQVARTDFGRHVIALGRLLEKTEDTDHAYSTRKEYMQKVQGAPVAATIPATQASAGNPFREGDEVADSATAKTAESETIASENEK